MNTAEETQAKKETDRKQDGSRPAPAEEQIKEFEEYLLDIGVRI